MSEVRDKATGSKPNSKGKFLLPPCRKIRSTIVTRSVTRNLIASQAIAHSNEIRETRSGKPEENLEVPTMRVSKGNCDLRKKICMQVKIKGTAKKREKINVNNPSATAAANKKTCRRPSDLGKPGIKPKKSKTKNTKKAKNATNKPPQKIKKKATKKQTNTCTNTVNQMQVLADAQSKRGENGQQGTRKEKVTTEKNVKEATTRYLPRAAKQKRQNAELDISPVPNKRRRKHS